MNCHLRKKIIDQRSGTQEQIFFIEKANKPQQWEYDTARLLPKLAIIIHLVAAVRDFPMANAVRPVS